MAVPTPISGNTVYPSGAAFGRKVQSIGDKENIKAFDPVGGPSGPVYRIAIAGAENSETYSAQFVVAKNGTDIFTRTVTAETDGSATQTELRDALDAAILADELLMQALVTDNPTDPGTNLLDVNFKAGWTATITFPLNPTTDLSVSTQTAAVAAPTFSYGYVYRRVSGPSGQPPGRRSEGIQALAEVNGPVLTYTITNDASGAYSGTISLSDPSGAASGTYPFSFSGDASAATTDANAVAAFEALFPTATVTNPSTGSVVISWPVGYVAIPVTTVATGGSADLAVAVTDSGDAAPDLLLCVDEGRTAPATSLDGSPTDVTGPNATTNPLAAQSSDKTTQWTVPYTEAVSLGGDVWVESAAAGRGTCVATPTPTCIYFGDAEFVSVDPQASTESTIIAL